MGLSVESGFPELHRYVYYGRRGFPSGTKWRRGGEACVDGKDIYSLCNTNYSTDKKGYWGEQSELSLVPSELGLIHENRLIPVPVPRLGPATSTNSHKSSIICTLCNTSL